MDEIHGKDLTKGNIGSQLWSLSWPMMLSVFFYTLYNLVDAFWVSKISSDAIAAVSISQITLFVMISLGFGVTVGSGVLIAMNIGAKKKNEAQRLLGQSFLLAIILGALFTIIALVFRDNLLVLSGASGSIFEPAKIYFTITAAGSILFFILMTIMFSFNSQGDTSTLTKYFAISTLVNIVLDPIFIFGWLGFPALGIAGAAYATLISQIVFIIIALRSLAQSHRMVQLKFSNLRLRWNSVKEVLNIGFPAALTQLIFPLGIAILTYLTTNAFQEAGAVAFSLGFRAEFFAYLPAVGFGFGAMAMMGQNIGAKNKERALKSFYTALKLGIVGAAVIGILVAIFAKQIVGVFTQDPLVIQYALSYMYTVTFTYGFLAALLIEAPAFQAMDRSWPGLWIFFIRFFVITLPISYILVKVFDVSIIGVWIGIMLGNIVASIIGYFWISRLLRRMEV